MRNIILCGFMGCGKTTLAKSLAQNYGMELIDTDEEIVKAEGRPIAEIFYADGEPYFRELETKLIKKLAERNNCVISLGGGLAANEKNHPYLKKAGIVILLDCGIEQTLRRITGDKTRPLTAGGKEDIKKRYYARLPLYKAVADATVDSSKSRRKTLENAIKVLEELK